MVLIKVRVIPNSKKDEIIEEGGFIKIKIREKAEKGKANAYLIRMLKSKGIEVKIKKGNLSREKLIDVKKEDFEKLKRKAKKKEST